MNFERNSAGYLTNRAGRLMVRALDRRLKPIGLSAGHMPVIAVLHDGSEMTQQALAELAHLEQPTMAATLSRMERDGLVARKPNPKDRRSSLVFLTPMALEKCKQVWKAVEEINEIVFAGMSEDERERYKARLRAMTARLVAAEDEAR